MGIASGNICNNSMAVTQHLHSYPLIDEYLFYIWIFSLMSFAHIRFLNRNTSIKGKQPQLWTSPSQNLQHYTNPSERGAGGRE